MKLLYKGWNEVPIKVYKEIRAIVEDESLEATERSVALLAALCGVDDNEIWALSLPEISQMSTEIGWLNSTDFDKGRKPHKLRISNRDYVVNYEVQKMSIAAYVDFQNYFKDRDNNMGALLTTFVIPKGCRYAEGYDPAELAKTFEAEVPIATYNTLLYFFVLTSLRSIRAMLIYSELEIQKAERENLLTEEMKEKHRMIADMFGSLLSTK